MIIRNATCLALCTITLVACGHHHSRHDPVPTPAPEPTTLPVPATPDPNKLYPKLVDASSLPDDYGFTATYSRLPTIFVRFHSGDTIVKVARNHIQLRNNGDHEILDCQFTDQLTPTMRYVVDGKKQKLDNFLSLTCLFMDQATRPIQNLKELCDAYGCRDEKVGEFETTRIFTDNVIAIEKESSIRIQDGNNFIMTRKVPGAPSAADFEIVETP
jgi:hypothetical protein